MSLEQALADNTAAVLKLADILAKQSAIAALPVKPPLPAPSSGEPQAAASTPPAAAPTPPTADAPAAQPAPAANSAVSYDDLKKTFFDLVNAKGVPAAQAWLKEKGLLLEGKNEYHLTAAKPEQYPTLRDDLLKLKAA